MGIEPTRPAWKAGILPLNYTRIRFQPLYYITFVPVCQEVLGKFFTFFENIFYFVDYIEIRRL